MIGRYICEVCNQAYLWLCLKNSGCYTERQREEVDKNDNWACLGCAHLNYEQKQKDILNQLTKSSYRSPVDSPGNRKSLEGYVAHPP